MSNIRNLYEISRKEEKLIIGLMSGTSLDGLDIALCQITGNGKRTRVNILEFQTIEYPISLSDSIRKISQENILLQDLTLWNAKLGSYFGELVNQCLQNWRIDPVTIDLVASHGQTIYHAPASKHNLSDFPNATLQIADGDHIAAVTGIITLSDFRQKHIAAGGAGAPLAVYADYLLFAETLHNVVMLNIGGIANFTFLPHDDNNIICTDTGPGNTLMDAWMRTWEGKPFDNNGEYARTGTINSLLLKALKSDPFFKSGLPKSTGPEYFNLGFVEKALLAINDSCMAGEDVMATLTRFTAETISECIQSVSGDANIKIYPSGGGINNSVLMEHLQELNPLATFLSTDEKGILPEAKEAVIFAILANESISGSPETFNRIHPNINFGKISFPT